jgi:SnoaL-like protein
VTATIHPLAQALSSSDPEAIAACLAEDIAFSSPIHTKLLRGKERVLEFFDHAERLVADLTYYDSAADDELTILFWHGGVFARPIEGATVIGPEVHGQVGELAVLMRSWSVVHDFRDAMLIAASTIAPLEAWTLGDADAAPPDPDSCAGRSPTLALAPDVRFHSPMLVKTIAGDENVHQVHRLIGGIQGPRVYHARLRRERRLVEHWSCVIDGHCQQGIDVFDLDEQDRVTDQRVWLRPWPVTNLLRDRAMASGLDILPIDVWIPPAHPRPLA